MVSIKCKLIFWTIFFFILSNHLVYLQKEADESCTTNQGIPGTCKPINQCQSAQINFKDSGIIPTTCGFLGGNPIVCCVESTTQPILNNSAVKESISERKCEEYNPQTTETLTMLNLMNTSNFVRKCDYKIQKLIVIYGGDEVDRGQFPHMAAIGWNASDGNGYKWKCGGTLISDDYVLTAAHCTFATADDLSGNEPTVVRLGEHNLFSDNDGVSPQDVAIAQIIKHPKYKPPNKYHDIALLKLLSSTKSIQNKFIKPACLWTKSTFDDNVAKAIGWGLTENKTPSNVLKGVSLDIIDNESCSKFYRKGRKFTLGIINEQMCAGNYSGGSDTCQGDSGGPLLVYSKDNRCIQYIIGLTSFGNGCGNVNTAGVYTRISSYINWIESTVWPGQA